MLQEHQELQHQRKQLITNMISCSSPHATNATTNILERVKILVHNATKQILRVSEMHLSEAIEILQNKQEKRIEVMKNRYEEKLRLSRKSHCLEREQQCFAAKAQSKSAEEKIESYYEEKLLQANMEIEKYVEMSKLQDKALYESQQSNVRVERMLQKARDDYLTYKAVMDSKMTRMKDKLECKRVYGFWTKLQVAHLRKKRRLAEQALVLKQKECEKVVLEITELKSKLSTSMKIREGLEKAFEKRAEIRGLPSHTLAMRTLQRRSSFPSSKTTPLSLRSISGKKDGEQRRRRMNCVNSIGVQASLYLETPNTHDAGVDAPPWYQEKTYDELVRMKAMMMSEEVLLYCRNQLGNCHFPTM